MNAPSKQTALVAQTQTTSLSAMSEQELMGVLQNSLYPGAGVESIKMVIGYCKAAGLDPMQKPVHIVPMDVAVKDEKGNIKYQKRDVIMPGIGLYRTQASRTNLYAGVSEPEFGVVKKIATQRKQYNNAHKEDKTFTMVEDGEIEFPEWCRVTVKRLVGNIVVDFTAKEFWLENYATSGKDSTAPNAMWKRRPYAQLAKCAEAQALRKAFPELGAMPTADEMEGKEFEVSDTTQRTPITEVRTILPECTAEKFAEMCIDQTDQETGEVKKMGWKSLVKSGNKTAEHLLAMLSTKYEFSDEQREEIQSWGGAM